MDGGLVFGAFGEGSSECHALLDRMAGDVASRDWAQAGFADIGDAKAAASRQLCRTFGLAGGKMS